MITVLTSFKPFLSGNSTRQRNALASWKALKTEIEVIAFGNAEGLEEISREFGVRIVEEIPSYAERLPRIDKVFEYAQQYGKYELQVYLNGDILLFDDFLNALQSLRMPRFVMIGQRTDVDILEPLDFSSQESCSCVRERLVAAGKVHTPYGIDYFAYRRGSMPILPPLYLGAAKWDNITVYSCRCKGIPVVDATLDIRVFHQNHEYQLLGNGKPAAYYGEPARMNSEHVANKTYLFSTLDASYWLINGRAFSSLVSPRHASHMILTYPIIRGRQHSCLGSQILRVLAAIMHRLGRLCIKIFWDQELCRRVGLY